MGVSLVFQTVEAVPSDVTRTILSELETLCEVQPWMLCEPPSLDLLEEDDTLWGQSKLHLQRSPEELEEVGREGAGTHDLRTLVDALCQWSARFGLTWRLSILGSPIGGIANGVCDGDLHGKLDALADVARELGRFESNAPSERNGRRRGRNRGRGRDTPGLRIWPEPGSDEA